jgi:SRSO17 transposase
VLDHTATTWLRRLLIWLERFEDRFSRQSQRGALRRYVAGLLSDSRRKSMEAMWARLSDPGTYQAFQHFITHAPWHADAVWKRLRAVVPERTGVLILDGTSFPKQGTASVGVARQYCGARGKIANCQVAVTVALWNGARAWLLGATLYLPEEWLTPRQRARAQIPATVQFEPKWQLALTLLRQVRAAGFTVTAVVGDAEFGDNATLRRTLHRAKLPYALGVSSDLKVFLGTPVLAAPAPPTGKGRPRPRRRLPPDTHTLEARAWAATQAPRQWRLVSWRNGTNPAWRARASVPSGSRPRTIGASDGSPPKSGCSANGNWHTATASATTWWICHRRPRCARWSPWRTSDGPSNSSTKSSRTRSDSITSKGAACRDGNVTSC